MITPRRTRLVRARNLRDFRRSIARVIGQPAAGSFVLVPASGAAVQLSRSSGIPADVLITRDQFYDVLGGAARRLTAFERDAMMQSAASAGGEQPFQVRPGLVGEMLRFYDQLRRQSQSVLRFRELMEGVLGGGAADADRGTERLLRQTRFLADAFAAYERLVAESGAVDEHALRGRLISSSGPSAVRHLVVTVADWIADPDGLFVADFDVLARLPGLEHIDIVCTEAVLGSGFHQRLHDWLPGIEEDEAVPAETARVSGGPRLEVPAGAAADQPWFTCRDREEELLAIARRLQQAVRSGDAAASPADRAAIIFVRPLPYLYLAAETLGAAGIPFQSSQALPLAAEPVAAAVDLVLDAVETGFTRPSLVALLRSPHFRIIDDDGDASVSALDRFLSKSRYLGEAAKLESIANVPADARPALDGALALIRDLEGLLESRKASAHLLVLKTVLEKRLRPLDHEGALADRERRGRAALLQLLDDMAGAHSAHHDPDWTVEDLAGNVRRWIGEQTFTRADALEGVRLLDDQEARYAEADDLTLVGLIENEWPERPRRNIFYPGTLLRALGWPSERDRRSAAEARFLDLLASATQSVRLSTFTLEDEALVTRSILLDEVPRARLSVVPEEPTPALQAMTNAGPTLGSGESPVSLSDASDPKFHGSLGPITPRPWSVSALETYLDCPFKFFAQHMLKLQEEPEEEEVMDPRRQGQFVHDVFERFFRAWQSAGRRAITPSNLDAARELFTSVVEEALGQLTESEAGLERTRLLGSPAAAGLGEAVLRMEAERPVEVVERLLEHSFKSPITIQTAAGPRVVSLKGKADRLDLLADGTFRLIDYKLGWPPNRARALQLPIYGLAAEHELSQRTKRAWRLGEAVYLAFKGPRRVVPLFSGSDDRDEVLARAQERLAETIDAIERGEFPPRPDDVYRCETCSYAAVCRKDYVGDV